MKYIKYKSKYLNLKKMLGGMGIPGNIQEQKQKRANRIDTLRRKKIASETITKINLTEPPKLTAERKREVRAFSKETPTRMPTSFALQENKEDFDKLLDYKYLQDQKRRSLGKSAKLTGREAFYLWKYMNEKNLEDPGYYLNRYLNVISEEELKDFQDRLNSWKDETPEVEIKPKMKSLMDDLTNSLGQMKISERKVEQRATRTDLKTKRSRDD
jgi:hypothetical protein